MKKLDTTKSLPDIASNPSDCPFREFRDNELSAEYWGLGPIAFKSAVRLGKGGHKSQMDNVWVDDQIQPLPRSAKKRFHSWVRAEDLAMSLWQTDVTIFEALLKLAAPAMDSDDESDNEDQTFNDFDILQALTGAMNLTHIINDIDQLWKRISAEVPQFVWDDDDDTITSTVKTKTQIADFHYD
ncbi:unnamed protein product, partial [Iphiclides podalirius]